MLAGVGVVMVVAAASFGWWWFTRGKNDEYEPLEGEEEE
jgi:Tfp pilus assembly protein PilO